MSVISLMNWKSSALLSGAALMAGYFVTAPASNLPGSLVPEQPREAGTPVSASSDIEEQADRLQARLRQEALFREPSRNPFRFRERPAAPPPAARVGPLPVVEAPAAVTPPPPPIRLAGLAIDGATRTAILSAPSGVFLVVAGDEVLGFRVSAVDEDAVTLVNAADGTTLTLRLKN